MVMLDLYTSKATDFFIDHINKRGGLVCPVKECRGDKIYKLSSGRLRCKKCKRTFSWSTGRVAGYFKIKPNTWLRIIDLFCDEVPAIQISNNVYLSNKTVLSALNWLRLIIFMEHQIECKEFTHTLQYVINYYSRQYNRMYLRVVPVIALLTHGSVIEITQVKCAPSKLVYSKDKISRRGSLFYTDKGVRSYYSYEVWEWIPYEYDSLMFYENNPCFRKKVLEGKVYIDKKSKFWNFAKEKLANYYGVSSWTFPLYMCEIRLRYLCRSKKELYDKLLDYISAQVPAYLSKIKPLPRSKLKNVTDDLSPD